MMEEKNLRLVIISHAAIKQINRAVYRQIVPIIDELHIVIPASLVLGSGIEIKAEPAAQNDPRLIPLNLEGRNPRLYFYHGLNRVLDSIKPSVIILENDPVSRLGICLSMWCRNNAGKLICQSYENISRGFRSTLRHRGWKGLLKNMPIHMLNYFMAPYVDGILVVNRDGERIFTNYRYKNVVRIPLGYDKNVFFEDSENRRIYRTKLNLSENCVVIAYFGRLVKDKGVHILVETLASMQDQPWKLLLDHIHDSNDGYVQYMKSIINQKGLDDRVVYFEADHFEIANYMRAADIVVAPSLVTPDFKEQYGRAVQEAMACGCVCLVSDSGHLPDLVSERSLVFNHNDVTSLRNSLHPLIADVGIRRNFQRILVKRAQEKLTTEIQAIGLIRLIQRLLVQSDSTKE